VAPDVLARTASLGTSAGSRHSRHHLDPDAAEAYDRHRQWWVETLGYEGAVELARMIWPS
jgi:hypothetical protein